MHPLLTIYQALTSIANNFKNLTTSQNDQKHQNLRTTLRTSILNNTLTTTSLHHGHYSILLQNALSSDVTKYTSTSSIFLDILDILPPYTIEQIAIRTLRQKFAITMVDLSRIQDALKAVRLMPLPPITHQSTTPVFEFLPIGMEMSDYCSIHTITYAIMSGEIPNEIRLFHWLYLIESVIQKDMTVDQNGDFKIGKPSPSIRNVCIKLWCGLRAYTLAKSGAIDTETVMKWAYGMLATINNEAKPVLLNVENVPGPSGAEYLTKEKLDLFCYAKLYKGRITATFDAKTLMMAHAIIFGAPATSLTNEYCVYYPPPGSQITVGDNVIHPSSQNIPAIACFCGFMTGVINMR